MTQPIQIPNWHLDDAWQIVFYTARQVQYSEPYLLRDLPLQCLQE